MPKLPPDPEGMNDDRAEWVEDALRNFANATGQKPDKDGWPEIVGDFITDLAHFCDRNGLDLRDRLLNAYDHYREETAFKGKQLDPFAKL